MTRIARIVLVAVTIALAVVTILWLEQELPTGPVPVAWDDEPCKECRMHVGEPGSAAQLQTRAGDVLNFDDPGCLLRWTSAHHPPTHAIYFHDSRSDRWLTARDTAFLPGAQTPMGYGLAAVQRGTAGAVSLREARRIVATHGDASERAASR